MITPNQVASFDGFHISLNCYEVGYDVETTAIVIGNHRLFLILNGNHFQKLIESAKNGLTGCIDYFHIHKALVNKHSEHRCIGNVIDPLNVTSIAKEVLNSNQYELLKNMN